ncbi:MAG: cytochrome ubiquinol oxidase subunit I [Bacteroidales bacterium]
MENFDISLVDWSRWQFALTACYHWIFVPLTLGLSVIIALMESAYVKTALVQWKHYTQFWMRLFGVNFAIGVATGLILEFEFGTNWSNYSWFVGDIFGAPLAIEGIVAFFLEATFFAVMFFGWNKVGKKFHLFSTWMVAIGSNLSALWILIANAWMQNPVGVEFNPMTARNEMTDFAAVVFSSTAINKFTHTVSSSFVLAAIFVVGISAWFLLKNRHSKMAWKSIKVASVVGLLGVLATAYTGHSSAYDVAKNQPMKLAAMEGLYDGSTHAPLVLVGILNPAKTLDNQKNPIFCKIALPQVLSWLATGKTSGFVPGINDLLHGNPTYGIPSTEEKMDRGKIAIQILREYQMIREHTLIDGDTKFSELEKKFDRSTIEGQAFYQNYFRYFGYGYLNSPKENVPPISIVFYGFRIMVLLGLAFIGLFILVLLFSFSDKAKQFLQERKKLYRVSLWVLIFCIPLAYIGSMLGWVVAEVGRQPWMIQDLMPCKVGVTDIAAPNVKLTFAIFAILFTVLFLVECSIMFTQIKKGPREE